MSVIFFCKLGQQINQLQYLRMHICAHMCLYVFDCEYIMLHGGRIYIHSMCLYVCWCAWERKVQNRSMLSQGSVARATVWELLVVAIRVTFSLMKKLTRRRGGRGGHGGRGAEEIGELTVRASWYPPGDLCLFWKDPWSPTAPEASAPGGSSVSTSLHLH